jgi:hypothetical protein
MVRSDLRGSLRYAVVLLLASRLIAAAADFCIAGTVVNAVTGEPMRRTAVTIPQTAALTDAAGAFRFCGLPAASYLAHAEKPGFTPADIRVIVGPSREDVLLRLQPLAIVKGTVSDAKGEPLENALIQLLSITTQDGRRKVKLEAAVPTDDRGEYRLPGLAPGRYLLRAAGWQGPSPSAKPADKQPDSSQTFAPVYYGGGTDLSSATPLTVEAGREVSADFSVTLETSYKVRGTIAGSSALLNTKIELLGPEGDLSAAPVAFNAATGAFQIGNVAPGSYILRATQGEGDERLRAEQSVEVGSSDVSDVLLPLASAVVLKGSVRMADASGASTQLSPSCTLQLTPTAAAMSDEAVLDSATGDDGSFDVAGVLPGRYRLRMDCANGYLATAHAGETDLLAHDELVVSPGAAPPPLEAILNSDGATVDVTATQDSDGDPLTAWFALVPDSGNDLHIRFAILKGKLSLSSLAPGDYHAYAWVGSPYQFEYANPEARQAWAGRAVGVHVSEHDHQSITIKVAPGESQ